MPASLIRGADPDHVDAVLAQWAEVRPDLDMTPVATIARLGRASAYIDAGVDARLAEFGLIRSSWDAGASLRRSGPGHRLSPTQLYLELMRTSGAITDRLAGLEQAGLIRRIPDPEDGRGLLVELTPEGTAIVDHITPHHLANQRALLNALTREEQATLVDLLRKLLASFERESPIPPPSSSGRRRDPARRDA